MSSSFQATRTFAAIAGPKSSTRCSALKRKRPGPDNTLTFHPGMESLLAELKSEIPPIPDAAIFEFLYRELTGLVQELESNSGCRATSSGEIKQARFTTDAPELIEVRLEVEDTWVSADGARGAAVPTHRNVCLPFGR